MTSLSIILMDVILLVFLLMLSIPLPVCFAGALLFLSLFGDVSMKTMLIWVFSQSTGTVLLASPLFILAGTYMGGSGIAKRLLDCVDAFVGHIKSGLGVVAVLVCAIMGAISGSGFTGVAATGPIMIPKMEEQGYPRGYATALVNCILCSGASDSSQRCYDYVWMGDGMLDSCLLFIHSWSGAYHYGFILHHTCILEPPV